MATYLKLDSGTVLYTATWQGWRNFLWFDYAHFADGLAESGLTDYRMLRVFGWFFTRVRTQRDPLT